MTKIKALSIAILLIVKSFGQSPEAQDEFIHRDFQISILSPLGTNGIQSGNCINRFSLNLFGGYAAGVEGAEFAGFANIITNDMNGAQFAGFFNLVNGTTNGFQSAGFTNINREAANATQLAGFTNIATDRVSGAQFAGFANIAGEVKGIQSAGFINITKITDGTQIAGFMNYSGRLNGLQLGVVNIVDSLENGTPISVFTIVKHGYNHWEIWAGEAMNANLGFKFGTRNFYNILAVGASFKPVVDQNLFGIGYGFGHVFPLSKGQISLDALGYQLLDIENLFQSEGQFNQLTQLKLSYDFMGKHINYFIGPTFNVLTQFNKKPDQDDWRQYAPYSFYKNESGGRRINMWVGAQAGIRF